MIVKEIILIYLNLYCWMYLWLLSKSFINNLV